MSNKPYKYRRVSEFVILGITLLNFEFKLSIRKKIDKEWVECDKLGGDDEKS